VQGQKIGSPIDRKAQMCKFHRAMQCGLGPLAGRVGRKGVLGHRYK